MAKAKTNRYRGWIVTGVAVLIAAGAVLGAKHEASINIVSTALMPPVSSCDTSVGSLNVSGRCGVGSYRSGTYTCTALPGEKFSLGDPASCRNLSDMFDLAAKACRDKCQTPSPLPIPSGVKPSPTPLHSPQPGCRMVPVKCLKAPCPEIKSCSVDSPVKSGPLPPEEKVQ